MTNQTTHSSSMLRHLIPVRGVAAVMDCYLQGFNLGVDVDHKGRLRDQRYLKFRQVKAFGAGCLDRPEGAVIRRAIKDYRDRRALCQSPLRRKSESRLKTIPVVGPVLKAAVQAAYVEHGIDPASVVNARIRRCGPRYFVHFTMRTPAPDPVKRMSKLLERVIRRSDMEEVAVCSVPEGLDVVVTNTRKKNNLKLYHIAVEHVIAPGFAQAFFKQFCSKANTVALDESMLPHLSGAQRTANAELRRWCRAQQAVGAIEFGLVSNVGEETQECITHLEQAGLSTRTLRSGLRSLRREALLKCPHCGAPVTLKLDPKTLTPTGESAPCTVCRTLLRAGHLLATRASCYVLYDWLYGKSHPGHSSDCVDAAPEEKTTITTPN